MTARQTGIHTNAASIARRPAHHVIWKACVGLVVFATSACVDDGPITAASNAGTGGSTSVDEWEIAGQNRNLGRGLNLGNCLDAPTEGAWGAVLTENDFTQAKALGFDSVRIPVRWSTHVSAEPPYTIDPDFLTRVDWAIQQARSNHLKAVIDVHHFTTLMADPAMYHDVLTGIWKQLAQHFASTGSELYFELLNEPYNQITTELWNSWVPNLISIIRENNPKRSIIVGGVGNSIEGLLKLELPIDPYLITTFHFYDPQTFTFQGLGSGMDEWVGTRWFGSKSDLAVLEPQFQAVADWQTAHARPVFLGEFGTGNKADMESRVRYTAYIASVAKEHDWSNAIWDNHGDMSIRDGVTGEVYQGIVDALMHPDDVLESTKDTNPPLTLPTGPSVLVDDFEDAFGDLGSQSYVMAAKASVTGSTTEHSAWYSAADDSTHLLGINDTPLVTYGMSQAQNIPMNMQDAIGNVGFTGGGLRVAGQLAGGATYGSVGAVLMGQIGVDWDWVDLTPMTAVSFRAKGTGVMRMSLISQYCLSHYPEGQNWGQLGMDFVLSNNWEQFVLSVSDFHPTMWSPAAADGVTWAMVRDRVASIEFGFRNDNVGPVELMLDDIRLHGVGYDAFGFSYSEP